MKSALKILCRQCSLLACANIISSTSVGLRPQPGEGLDAGSRSRRRTAPGRRRVLASSSAARPRPSTSTCSIGSASRSSNSAAASARVGSAALGHAVVQQRRRRPRLDSAPRVQRLVGGQAVLGDALDAAHVEPAVVRDVGGLAGPGRHRAQARRHDDDGDVRARGVTGIRRAVGEQPLDGGRGGLVERLLARHPVHVPGRDGGERRAPPAAAGPAARRRGTGRGRCRPGRWSARGRATRPWVRSPGRVERGGCRAQGYRGRRHHRRAARSRRGPGARGSCQPRAANVPFGT